MSSIYVAVGTEDEWKDYSRPKRLRVAPDGPTLDERGILFRGESIDWEVRRSCTITHAHLLDDRDRTLKVIRFDQPVSVRKWDQFTLDGPRFHMEISEPYDGPCLV